MNTIQLAIYRQWVLLSTVRFQFKYFGFYMSVFYKIFCSQLTGSEAQSLAMSVLQVICSVLTGSINAKVSLLLRLWNIFD